MDHLNLRQDVSDFALETQCDHIQQLRESYEQVIQTASEKSWLEYWEETRKPGEWVDYIFIQVTASFLLRDIVIGNHQNRHNGREVKEGRHIAFKVKFMWMGRWWLVVWRGTPIQV